MKTQTLRTTDLLPDLEVEAIADFIANMHDLPVEDLLSDFCTTMLASFPTLDRKFLEQIYNSFMSIGPETRFDLKFNKIIESGTFKRPLSKTVRHHFGDHTTLYGGRKGFTDLMLSHQQQLENISQWMGHSTIERTWRNYKSRCITHYDLPDVSGNKAA